MLTLTHKAKNKWPLRSHLKLNQKHSNFGMLRISIGICLFNQLPASVYCIPYSKFLVKKKIWVYLKFVAIDDTQQMVILAIIRQGEKEAIVGMGQYALIEKAHTAENVLPLSHLLPI